MSIYSNPIINTIDIPWKIFVRGNDEVEPEKPSKTFHGELSFSGDAARKAYEEILINTEQQKNVNIKKQDEKQEDKSLNLTSKSKKVQTKVVTVNAIMKAIEQRDLTFLKDHIHSENVNNTDSFGWTPLMLAAYCGFVEIVDFLLKCGANKKFREKSGLTAAQLALKKNYLDIVALLRKNDNLRLVDNFVNFEDLNINKSNKGEESTNNHNNIHHNNHQKNHNDYHNNNHNNTKIENEKEVEIYCAICKGHFKSAGHESSILHLFNSKPKLPSTLFGIPKANKGYQMLLSTGWDEEHGLGRDGKGKKFPVKTVLKLDRKGLGLSTKVESRITHFKPGDSNAIKTKKYQTNIATKKDREKLLTSEARKERALRIALS